MMKMKPKDKKEPDVSASVGLLEAIRILIDKINRLDKTIDRLRTEITKAF